jgi:hypothetical protein
MGNSIFRQVKITQMGCTVLFRLTASRELEALTFLSFYPTLLPILLMSRHIIKFNKRELVCFQHKAQLV